MREKWHNWWVWEVRSNTRTYRDSKVLWNKRLFKTFSDFWNHGKFLCMSRIWTRYANSSIASFFFIKSVELQILLTKSGSSSSGYSVTYTDPVQDRATTDARSKKMKTAREIWAALLQRGQSKGLNVLLSFLNDIRWICRRIGREHNPLMKI